jgi:hypothetical protein
VLLTYGGFRIASHTRSRIYFMFENLFNVCLLMISHYASLLQLTVLNRGMWDGQGSSRNRICNFHFRVKENGVEYFFPGSRA